MAESNLASILDKPASDIKRPPPMPAGHYIFTIIGLPRFDKSSKKQTDFYEFKCRFTQAYDDVDDEELAAVGGIAGKETNLTFYITEKSVYRLTEFMRDDLGISDEGKTSRQMLDETPNCQFVGLIKHAPSEDGKGVYANITTTGPVEA